MPSTSRNDRASQAHALDGALPGLVAELDVVTLEELALDDDEDAHQVVEHDGLARDGDTGQEEADEDEDPLAAGQAHEDQHRDADDATGA